MKNEVFEVLKTEKEFFFLMFKDFFLLNNEGFKVLKTEKIDFFS